MKIDRPSSLREPCRISDLAAENSCLAVKILYFSLRIKFSACTFCVMSIFVPHSLLCKSHPLRNVVLTAGEKTT